jgi:hypothetical protein
VHPVGGVEEILDQDRHPVQQAARAGASSFGVEAAGVAQCVGVDFDDGPKGWSAVVDAPDAVQVVPRQLLSGQRSPSHQSRQFGDAEFVQRVMRIGESGRLTSKQRYGGCHAGKHHPPTVFRSHADQSTGRSAARTAAGATLVVARAPPNDGSTYGCHAAAAEGGDE